MKYSEQSIQQALFKEYKKTSIVIVPNCYLDRYEADIYRITKANYSIEYEIKINYQDFLKDSNKKKKHLQNLKGQRVNRFYYVCPEGLINENEINKAYGLLYIQKVMGWYKVKGKWRRKKVDGIKLIKAPVWLHKQKVNKRTINKIYRKFYFRYWNLKNY